MGAVVYSCSNANLSDGMVFMNCGRRVLIQGGCLGGSLLGCVLTLFALLECFIGGVLCVMGLIWCKFSYYGYYMWR